MSRYKYTAEDTRALAWCNEVRVKMGKKPVRYIRKGVPGDPRRCAIAETIGKVLVGDEVHNDDYSFYEIVPRFVWNWIGQFDTGKIPHFIEEATHA